MKRMNKGQKQAMQVYFNYNKDKINNKWYCNKKIEIDKKTIITNMYGIVILNAINVELEEIEKSKQNHILDTLCGMEDNIVKLEEEDYDDEYLKKEFVFSSENIKFSSRYVKNIMKILGKCKIETLYDYYGNRLNYIKLSSNKGYAYILGYRTF